MIRIYGVVLAGGKSSRMGRDKKSVILPNGFSMEENTLRILNSSNCHQVFVSGIGEIPDIHPCRGPLGGIEAVLNVLHSDCILFLPCDMPFVKPFQVDTMITRFLQSPHLPAVAMAPYMEPLFAAVPVSWREMVSNAVAIGHLKVGKFWRDTGFTPVMISDGELLKDADFPREVPA